ncbi:MAG: hypothetical protein AzoDbin1_05447, partial [Azoarcus sp.]|nr:hypothetical protein [Azoarcus sp.]
MLTRAQKEEEVGALRDKLARATGVFVADYRGLSVQQVDRLRAKLREAGQNQYQVAKNRLLQRASAGSAGAVLAPCFEGPTAVAFAFGDPLQLAKLLVDYAKHPGARLADDFRLHAGGKFQRADKRTSVQVQPATAAEIAVHAHRQQRRAGVQQAESSIEFVVAEMLAGIAQRHRLRILLIDAGEVDAHIRVHDQLRTQTATTQQFGHRGRCGEHLGIRDRETGRAQTVANGGRRGARSIGEQAHRHATRAQIGERGNGAGQRLVVFGEDAGDIDTECADH